MGAIAGFMLGYYFGTKEGREGLTRLIDSWQYISKSDEFKTLLSSASSMGAGLLKQSLSSRGGGVYPALAEGVVDLLARRRAA
jgi:hypothetical protein